MHTKLENWLFSFGLDTVQAHGAISVLPVIAAQNSAPLYLSLSAALSQGTITIAELSHEGRVPNLHVRNDADLPVLLLDGEELKGAKQNRIVNTTILVAAHSSLVIPVSCTEAGRWAYDSPVFQESGNVLSHSMRASKLERVNYNLRANRGYDAEQGVVWQEIRTMQSNHKIQSGTSAMHDVFAELAPKLESLSSDFPCLDGQCGIYVEINGRFAGLDLLSLPTAWSDVHSKLIRSYIIDYLEECKKKEASPAMNPDAVFKNICAAEIISAKSVGLGEDHRFENEDLLASALYYQKNFVHLAAYPKPVSDHSNEDFRPRRSRAFGNN